MSLLCILSAIAAFFALGLSTDGHHRKWRGAPPSPRLRRIGWVLLALCLGCAFAAKGWVYGPVYWVGAISFGAAASFLLLNLTQPKGA